MNSPDFLSYVLQAQASKAKVVALIASGSDSVNAFKAIDELGLNKMQKIVAMVTFNPEKHSLDLEAAQGLILNEAFYWNTDVDTRKFSVRISAKFKKMGAAVEHFNDVHPYSALRMKSPREFRQQRAAHQCSAQVEQALYCE